MLYQAPAAAAPVRDLFRDGGMASKAASTAEATETREEAAEAPLLDTIAAAIKKMLARGKERGYITYDELNAALPPDQVSSEQIEDTMAMLSELGINVVENEESEEPAAAEAEDGDGEVRGNLDDDDIGRTDDPGAHVSARDGQGRAAVARGRDRHRQAHRGRPRHDDRRHLREPADHPRASSAGATRSTKDKMLLRDIIDLDATYGSGGFDAGRRRGCHGSGGGADRRGADEARRRGRSRRRAAASWPRASCRRARTARARKARSRSPRWKRS